jgi:hypothetical protein
MNRADVRSLAAVASGAISMNCFYGKSSVAPTALGQCAGGGFYTGVVNHAGVSYYLLIAPNATGCVCTCIWKTTRTLTTASESCVNGYTNTYGALNNATHPAGNWTATRSISGFSDWYLPARDELNLLYINKSSMPAGEGFATCPYWSSTEVGGGGGAACYQDFGDGRCSLRSKADCRVTIRAVRRSPI